jgi:hypothetical protein
LLVSCFALKDEVIQSGDGISRSRRVNSARMAWDDDYDEVYAW